MPKKTLEVFLRIVFGIFLFYIIAGFILIPLFLTWLIPNQATKLLKHPVLLQSVGLNPFSLELRLKGFEILDNQNKLMLGFNEFVVDVSFVDLLKKIYHVKSLEVDGLQINAQLLTGNHVNLLDLLPSQESASKNSQQTVIKPAPLPAIVIDKIILHQGQLHIIDKTIKPQFSMVVGDIELFVSNVSTNPNAEVKVKFQAHLDDHGMISMETLIKPLAQPLEMETTFSINDYALGVLTPYVGKYTGREVKSGKMDLTMDYRIGDNKLSASHHILVQRFEFGNKVASKDALHLPFGLAIALLEDPQGKISIALPVTGNMSDPKFDYSHLMVQVVRNFFFNLVTKPFSFLASTLGVSNSATDELGYVRFSPGMVALTASQQQKLITLIASFMQHPKLRLEIDGSYDPDSDWKMIEANVFARDYQELRNHSSLPETRDYQLLYQRRFGIRALWTLAHKYKTGLFSYDLINLDREIKRQLIENSPPDYGALNILAQSRAKLVHDFLLINGFDAGHLTIGPSQATQSSMGYVPLHFTLTVFDRN